MLCGLRTLASLALASDSVAARLLTPPLSQQLQVTMPALQVSCLAHASDSRVAVEAGSAIA